MRDDIMQVSILPDASTPCKHDQSIYVNRHQSMSKFDSDGRRRLLGLSQAIRKHAYQSTSPSSEVKYRSAGHRLHQEQSRSNKCRTKTAPTVEDRLRSLLNSDTEGTESQSASNSTVTFDKPPTFELGSKGCHGSYSPRLAESKMRAERLNRKIAIEPKTAPNIHPHRIHQRTRSLSSESFLKEAPLSVNVPEASITPPASVCGSQVSEKSGNKLRRCLSSVPAAINDENWNVVPESPKSSRERLGPSSSCPKSPPLTPSTLGRRTPTGAYNLAIWDQRPPPSPSRVMTLPSTSSLPSSPRTPSSPTVWSSLSYAESAQNPSDSTRTALEYNQSPVPKATRSNRTPGKFLFRVGSPAPLSISQPGNQDFIRVATPASPCLASQVRQGSIERRPRPIQYVEPPSPAGIRMTSTMPRSTKLPHDELKVSSLVTVSNPPTPKLPAPVPVKRKADKTNKDVLKTCSLNPQAKKTNCDNTECTNDDEPESCKSEDRDSGAILDAEPSVFDFDSSVMSDSENETPRGTLSKMQTATRERIWSRSSTPTLPPLSPCESEVETPRIISPRLDRTSSQNGTVPHSPMVRNEVARLPSYDSLVRRKAANLAQSHRNENEVNMYARMDYHDHQELSPTESALGESCGGPDAITEVVTNHVCKASRKEMKQHRISKRRSSRAGSRASSCDDRRIVSSNKPRKGKHGNKHKSATKLRLQNSEEYTYYEIEEFARAKKTMGRYPVIYRDEEDNVASEMWDVEETSSVKSFTSASVTSSVIRKHGRRHHRRHYQHSGAVERAYAKEVRAVNRRFARLEEHVVNLARSVAQLSSQVRKQVEISRERDSVRTEDDEQRREKAPPTTKSSTASQTKTENVKKSIILKGQPKRVTKLTKFFGEKPPILRIFLTQLGYEKYVEHFNSESIGMVELAYMDEERLKSIGIPLGPRLRILSEAKKTCF